MNFYRTRQLGINREDELKQRKRNMNILLFMLLAAGYSVLIMVLHFASKV